MEEDMEENIQKGIFLEIEAHLAHSREFDSVEWLDKGAFGFVVKAKRRKDGISHAIKIIQMSEEGKRVKYQRRELEALTNVKRLGIERRNIIQYHNFWKVKVSGADYLCIQMELCLTSLWDFVFENEMGGPKIIQQDGPPRFYQQVFQQVLSGLSFIHAMGWVHRDIHPKNILIVNPSPKEVGDIHIKIADFGLAREIKTDDEQIQELTVINKLEKVSPLTVSGYFHAPELKTDSYDFKVDVYSAGLVLYFISRYHKDRQSVLMEIQDLRKGNLQVDENLYHKDDKKLSALIKNLTQKNPDARHSACKAEDFMFPKARISTNSCELEFLVRKQEEEDLSLCIMNETTLSEMAEAIEHHTRVPKRRQTLRQERMVNGVAKRIKIEYDKDVKNIFHVAAKHRQEVVVVVSENEEVEMTDISTEPMSV